MENVWANDESLLEITDGCSKDEQPREKRDGRKNSDLVSQLEIN